MKYYPNKNLMPEQARKELLKIGDIQEVMKSPEKFNFTKQIHQGYEIIQITADEIKGFIDFVILKGGVHRDHIHDEASAFLKITSVQGKVNAIIAGNIVQLSEGDEIFIPNGVAHGFEIPNHGELEFVSIQNKPIKKEDGTLDFRYVD